MEQTKEEGKQTLPLLQDDQRSRKKKHTVINTHAHKVLRTIIDGAIKLKDANPFQEFIVALQNLLKNGQLVDPHFAFCPIKVNSGTRSS